MSLTTEDFSRETTRVVPSLKPILREHLKDNFGEMLPHLYFGDVSRWVSREAAKPQLSAEVVALLQLFELSYPNADFYVQNLIDVSFIEMLQDDPAVVRLLGPVLLSRVDPEYRPRT